MRRTPTGAASHFAGLLLEAWVDPWDAAERNAAARAGGAAAASRLEAAGGRSLRARRAVGTGPRRCSHAGCATALERSRGESLLHGLPGACEATSTAAGRLTWGRCAGASGDGTGSGRSRDYGPSGGVILPPSVAASEGGARRARLYACGRCLYFSFRSRRECRWYERCDMGALHDGSTTDFWTTAGRSRARGRILARVVHAAGRSRSCPPRCALAVPRPP